jgi:hypothetical protein
MEELVKIQSDLNAPKNLVNKFGNYRYRSCESIVEALKPLLAKHKCYLLLNDEITLIGDRYYIKATATLVNANGVQVSTTAFAREEESKKSMDSSQLTGATSSYARKYALNGLFAIDDTKDADATNTHDKDESPTISKEDLQVWVDQLKLIKTTEELLVMYEQNKDAVNEFVEIKNLFSKRKKQLSK